MGLDWKFSSQNPPKGGDGASENIVLPEVSKEDLENVQVKDYVDLVKTVLKEDNWLSGLKKITASKKAVVAAGSLLMLVAGWLGKDLPPEMALWGGVVFTGGVAVVSGAYLLAQGKADAGKEATKEAGRGAMLQDAASITAAHLATKLKDKLQ